MLILGIDTSGKTASAAVCDENTILAETYAVTARTQSQVILPMCRQALDGAGVSLDDIEGIAVSKGPGSYTGLRIGISAAKGMCFGKNRGCAGISALEALAYNFRGMGGTDMLVCSVMYARQELVYNAMFRINNGSVERECADRIISINNAAEEISRISRTVYITGDYTEKLFAVMEEYSVGNVFPAPPHLRTVHASGLCFAASEKGLGGADALAPDYLQITKAEKDLLAGR